MTLWDAESVMEVFLTHDQIPLPHSEPAAIDDHPFYPFTEALVRRRTLTIRPKGFESIANESRDNSHLMMSTLFKSEISVLIELDQLIPQKDLETMRQDSARSGEPEKFKVRIISDGRKAYLKYLGF